MHLDKRKVLEVFFLTYSLPCIHSTLFAVPWKEVSLLEILLLLFPLPGTYVPKSHMTALLISFRDPLKCHFINKAFPSHTI